MKNNNKLMAIKVQNVLFPNCPDEDANLNTGIVVEEASRGWKNMPSPYALCVELESRDNRNSNNIKTALMSSVLRETGRDGYAVLELEVSPEGEMEYATTWWRLFVVVNATSAQAAKRILTYIFDGWVGLRRTIKRYEILTEGLSLSTPETAKGAIYEAEKYVTRVTSVYKGVRRDCLNKKGLKVFERTKHTKKSSDIYFQRSVDPINFLEFLQGSNPVAM